MRDSRSELELSAEYLIEPEPCTGYAHFFTASWLRTGGEGIVDISGVVLRFLERQGIWCYVACGGVRVEFPPESGIATRRFYPLMHRNNNAFHRACLVYAPPFKIVDVSISLQPYSEEQKDTSDGYTLTEQWDEPRKAIGIRDLMENELVEDHVRRFGRCQR